MVTKPHGVGNALSMEPTPSAFWRRQARLTALRYNAGWVLGTFLPLCLGASAVFACALLVVRENGREGITPWLCFALALLACLGFAVWRGRGRFFTVADALTRLDWHLGLHNRLSAASAGVGEFPAARPAPDGLAFHAPRIAVPLASAAALVFLAAWVPLSRRGATFTPTTAPIAWNQTAQWVDALQKTDLLQQPSLEELKERLEELRQQPARDWYSQSSLEAGDNLRDQTGKSIESLQRDLQSALGDLEKMQNFSDQTSATESKEAHDNLAKALQGLEMGNLPLNRELLDSLKNADLANLKTLTPEQLEALKQRLKSGDGVCKACLHPGDKPGGQFAVAAFSVPGKPRVPGPGGGGTAPLYLNEKPTDLHGSATDAVSNGNLEHALPGDLMGVGQGEHSVDQTRYTGLTSAGAVRSNGEGGEAVWRNDLTPKERTVLKNFFK